MKSCVVAICTVCMLMLSSYWRGVYRVRVWVEPHDVFRCSPHNLARY